MKTSIPHDAIPVMESFYTIQGEGAHSGKPAYFIRLGGCDVGCHWCDVKESWNAAKHPKISLPELVSRVRASGARTAVITGGEPLTYDLNSLTKALHAEHIKTHLETSGAYPLSGHWDWICFSPKKFKPPLAEFYRKSHELKVIIFNRSDFDWSQKHGARMHDEAQLFVQPEWSKAGEMLPLILRFVKKNQRWRISLQTHKYMNIP